MNFIIGLINSNNYMNDLNVKDNKINKLFITNLKKVLKIYFVFKKIETNWEFIEKCNDYNLVDHLAMICPILSEEKQLLLETKSIEKRYELLTSILTISSMEEGPKNGIKH